jgi:hypothetical protein
VLREASHDEHDDAAPLDDMNVCQVPGEHGHARRVRQTRHAATTNDVMTAATNSAVC